MGYIIYSNRFVPAGLGLHDLLAEGSLTPAQLAAATGADEHKLRRLLRFLVGRGLFQRVDDTDDGQPQFANNDLTNHLRKCAPPYSTNAKRCRAVSGQCNCSRELTARSGVCYRPSGKCAISCGLHQVQRWVMASGTGKPLAGRAGFKKR